MTPFRPGPTTHPEALEACPERGASRSRASSKCSATPAVSDEPLPDAWPPDFNDNQLVNLADWLSFNSRLGASPPNPAYDVRWDLNVSGLINLSDLLQLSPFMGKKCAP
jgi:hypothetical protein